ncbi:enoyl-CoA hydratase/isomerase family protein [Longimicrobium sp.]|uniref:enoyl-CoA hydratase/isomerase family protein n=1 Tax=Longimicrobium sp. TaxID=2029185 RepID=UPI002D162B15|nr:enoyl-CoA hydratase-related protein [Longimicrobium sp.]HSU14917.1 enoyl-CoA hydratase-related protein [Longimicrobium sp.]
MIERERSDDGILTLRLAHGKASAMDVELLEGMIRELDAAGDARAVIVTGTGSIFSAGVDLFRLMEGGDAYVRRFIPLLRDFVVKLFAFPRPVVVAANGHAIAGGGVMVMAGDYRLMAEGRGRLGVPELLVGVPFPAAALEAVRYAVPGDRIHSLVFTGRTFEPREALAERLVDEVVAADALMDRAREVAAQLAALAPDAFRLTKEYLRAPSLERIRASAAYDEQVLAAWSAPGTHARIRDYLERTVRKG